MPYRTETGRIIHAAYYATSANGARVVWFDEDGNHDPSYQEYGRCTRPDGKPVIITKAGEALLWDSVPFTVASVQEFPFKRSGDG